MSKVISPIVFRSKRFNTYINKQFLSFDKKYNSISYFKFFNIYINLIYLVKKQISNLGNRALGKYLYSSVRSINIKVISIDFIFARMYPEDTYLFLDLNFLFINLNLYFNYFKNYMFYGNIKSFFMLSMRTINYYDLRAPLTKLKFNFYDYIKFKKSMMYHCNKLFSFKYKRRFKIIGIKVVFSGRFRKTSNRTKTDVYTIGNLSIHTISSRFFYFTDFINTDKGCLGVKIWINVV